MPEEIDEDSPNCLLVSRLALYPCMSAQIQHNLISPDSGSLLVQCMRVLGAYLCLICISIKDAR